MKRDLASCLLVAALVVLVFMVALFVIVEAKS
jgi:hypothetical protein